MSESRPAMERRLASHTPLSEGEVRLRKAWARPAGIGILSEVNNTVVGRYIIVTGFAFFLLGGILALLIRTQLIVPENTLIDVELFNQLFTMHGTTMMFLFAVPIMLGFAVYLIPQMLGSRDLPFPRLSAYGFWCYLIGGLLVFGSLFIGAAPDSGWFMYPPLSSLPYSRGINTDIWLLGLSFVEISSLVAAVEMIVGILKVRAPGLSINRMPIFAWAVLVTAFMIVFAFPPLLAADIMLELERAFGWVFFDATRNGDPLLWQHLFWFFGHPEVYIIFLPAAGMVSMIVATFARRPLMGHTWVVMALIAVGFISFGLWVHHMFATGIPRLSLSFFSAASMAVAIPTGVQVFAWLATLLGGRPWLKPPLLFIYGFLFIFVLGGLTGVMIALVPFDWQVHDSYFIVAHLHYVLIGGMVFPLFAAFYYWMPLSSGRMLSERLGRWVFWLMFLGFNISFLPMHLTGLLGMPRRVYTYPAEMGWNTLNLISTLGAYLLAAGVLVFIIDVIRHHRSGEPVVHNPWNAGTLDWLAPVPFQPWTFFSVPQVHGRYPVWDQAELPGEVDRGEHFLADAPAEQRETLITDMVSAKPLQVLRIPGPTWLPLIAAVITSAFFLAAIAHLYALALVIAAVVLVIFIGWAWMNARVPPVDQVDAGNGVMLPLYLGGVHSHSWLGLFLGLLVDATLFGSLLFTYFYLWTAWPDAWPSAPFLEARLPMVVGLVLLLASSAAMAYAKRANQRAQRSGFWLGIITAFVFGVAFLIYLIPLFARADLDPTRHGFDASVWAVMGYHFFHVCIALLLAGYSMARVVVGHLTPRHDTDLRNTALFWHYTTGTGILALLAVFLFPF